jgi:hypothetical protein
MKSLGRIAAVCCWMTLAACGPEAPTTDTPVSSASNIEIAPPICPEVMPPPCEDGSLYPVYEGECLIGYECVPNVVASGKPAPICPVVMPPQCEGSLYPIYKGECLIGYECVEG